jgi:hypothetical protein
VADLAVAPEAHARCYRRPWPRSPCRDGRDPGPRSARGDRAGRGRGIVAGRKRAGPGAAQFRLAVWHTL